MQNANTTDTNLYAIANHIVSAIEEFTRDRSPLTTCDTQRCATLEALIADLSCRSSLQPGHEVSVEGRASGPHGVLKPEQHN